MIKRYRKKPVEIEALQWTGKNDTEIEYFVGDSFQGYGDNLVCYKPRSNQYLSKLMYIRTLEGVMIASVGDYIIKGVQGEFYSCKPEIFEQTYEEVIERRGE
jgi:hypothetical protein